MFSWKAEQNFLPMCGLVLASLVLLLLGVSSGVYLPGSLPRDYLTNAEIAVQVNLVRSSSTLIPYSYYSLPVCRPAHLEADHRNLGRLVSGSAPFNSLYRVNALRRVWPGCRTLCGQQHKAVHRLYNEDIRVLARLIEEKYEAEWIVDNLPVVVDAEAVNQQGQRMSVKRPFFPLGRLSDRYAFPALRNVSRPMAILYNHHKLTFRYQKMGRGIRLLEARVDARSINHTMSFLRSANPHEFPLTCWEHLPHEPLYLNESAPFIDVVWTYSVDWVPDSSTSWENRWDSLFLETDWESHWFGLFSSLLIMVPFSIVMVAVFFRTCRRTAALNVEEEIEQSGWKLLHGDVFRAPAHPMLYSILAGSGLQMVVLMFLVSFFSVLGMLAPPNRGGMVTAIVVLFILLGFLQGYASARLYRQFGGTKTLKMMGISMVLVPGIMLGLYFIINCIYWAHASSAGLTAWTVLAAFGLWLVHSVLVVLGTLLGVRMGVTRFPTSVNTIPRFIPKQPWYNDRVLVFLCSGIIPFAVFWIELYYILEAVWLARWIATFAFVFASVLALTVAAALVSILVVFLRLRTEDYHWWWRAFVTGMSPALYIYFYMLYFVRYMKLVSPASVAIYVVYSTIFGIAFSLYLGGVGVFANLFFVTNIFSTLQGLD